ncbi:MAG: c-type cytochrome [Deltaproteobacteria bacterium]|nr:c-type cytochrome [Deltaproteobacteria bacterium]
MSVHPSEPGFSGDHAHPHGHPHGGGGGDDPHHAHHSPWFYAGIAVFLGILTLIELGPLFDYYNLPATVLIGLSVVKFFTVVAFFMHLWDDDSIYTRVFGAPLLGAIAMVAVLMTLFHTWSPSPRPENFAVLERQYENWNGECSSWLYSAGTNRRYCASPPIPVERIALFAPKGGGSASGPPAADLTGKSPDEVMALLMKRGETLFNANCSACHQVDGKGITGTYPPLAGSDYFADPTTHAGIIINGLAGEIVVNGTPYNGVMASFGQLNDYNIAAIATYERQSWGNNLGVLLPEQVAAAR